MPDTMYTELHANNAYRDWNNFHFQSLESVLWYYRAEVGLKPMQTVTKTRILATRYTESLSNFREENH